MNQEIEKILKDRDRKRYLEELSELENKLASCHSRIFWVALNLLIIEPAITAGMVYYLWDQFNKAAAQGLLIANFWSIIKWHGLIIALMFLSSSLYLLYNLWRIASLKSEMARIRTKLSRLE